MGTGGAENPRYGVLLRGQVDGKTGWDGRIWRTWWGRRAGSVGEGVTLLITRIPPQNPTPGVQNPSSPVRPRDRITRV